MIWTLSIGLEYIVTFSMTFSNACTGSKQTWHDQSTVTLFYPIAWEENCKLLLFDMVGERGY